MTLALMARLHAHWTTATCYMAALRDMGIPFDHVDNNEVMQGHQSLANYDAVMVIDDGFGVYPYPTLPPNNVFVGIDWHCDPEKHYFPHIGQFHKLYAAQKSLGVDMLALNGIAAEWLPLAYDSIQMPYTEMERDIPVMFVASWSTDERKELKRIIAEKYKGFTKECYRQEMGWHLSRSKCGWQAFGMQTDWVVRRDHLAQRLWEVMGCGALLMQPRLAPQYPDLDLLGLEDGTHLILWDTIPDLLEKTDYYLAHSEEREKIATAGRAWVLNGHTYQHRVKKILADLGYEV